MENKFYVNHVVSQLESLLSLGQQAEGSEFIQGVLYNALSRVKSSPVQEVRADVEQPAVDEPKANPVDEFLVNLPNSGEVVFDEILNDAGIPVVRDGEAVVFQVENPETGEAENAAFVGGYGQDADTGQIVELAGTSEAIVETNRLLNEFLVEGDLDIEVDGLLRVTYKRENGEALTDENVMEIINAPISEGLRRFSKNLQLMAIQAGDAENVKTAVFSPVDVSPEDLDITAIALGMVRYGGTVAFPNIGLVSAKAEVNADWVA